MYEDLKKYDALQILAEAKQALKPQAEDILSRQFLLGSLWALHCIIQDGPEFVTEDRILRHMYGTIITFKDEFSKELEEMHKEMKKNKG